MRIYKKILFVYFHYLKKKYLILILLKFYKSSMCTKILKGQLSSNADVLNFTSQISNNVNYILDNCFYIQKNV